MGCVFFAVRIEYINIIKRRFKALFIVFHLCISWAGVVSSGRLRSILSS
jgi:hypothetical protein